MHVYSILRRRDYDASKTQAPNTKPEALGALLPAPSGHVVAVQVERARETTSLTYFVLRDCADIPNY